MTNDQTTAPVDYEDIEIVKGSGFRYRFFTRFPAMKMLEFNNKLAAVAKREIYNAMLENGEMEENPVGYQMVSSKLARSWVLRDGFESPALLKFLCTWIVTPLDEKAPPVLEAILEADIRSQGSWAGDPVEKQTPKTLAGLLEYLVERDLQGKAGMNLLKRFFIGLIAPTPVISANTTNSTKSLPEDGTEEKVS